MSRLTIHVRRRGEEHRVVSLDGELDDTTAPLLQEQLDALGVIPDDTITIDLRGLRSMDTNRLRSILRSRDHAENLGCQFVLVRGSAAIQRVFAPVVLEHQLAFIDGERGSGRVDGAIHGFGCDLSGVISGRRSLSRLART